MRGCPRRAENSNGEPGSCTRVCNRETIGIQETWHSKRDLGVLGATGNGAEGVKLEPWTRDPQQKVILRLYCWGLQIFSPELLV